METNMEKYLKEIGMRIRVCRKNQDISQEELAKRAQLHNTYIGQVERGEKNLTILSLRKIAGALGVSVSFLVSEEHRQGDCREGEFKQGYSMQADSGYPQNGHLADDIARIIKECTDEMIEELKKL